MLDLYVPSLTWNMIDVFADQWAVLCMQLAVLLNFRVKGMVMVITTCH